MKSTFYPCADSASSYVFESSSLAVPFASSAKPLRPLRPDVRLFGSLIKE
ncbi:hypothetical protein [Ottowia beijingensis]